jgi:hypothetical protein
MKRIKVTTNKKWEDLLYWMFHGKLWWKKWSYDEKNEAIRKRHSKLFKDDKYSFCPSDDLVKSISFDFICTLNKDQYIQLPNKWLKKLSKILKKAEVNLIAKMKLCRLLRPNECNKQPTESMDRIIYEAQLENGSFQIVSFEDISNLVGDEKSTQGDTNCLSDLGSTRWLKFVWGAKKRILHFQKMFPLQIYSQLEKMLLCWIMAIIGNNEVKLLLLNQKIIQQLFDGKRQGRPN